MAQNDLDWITPLLGFVGLLAGGLFLTGQKDSNNMLPPPPPNQKPSGCGCTAKKNQ